MSHPLRQQILHILFEGSRTVGELSNLLQCNQSSTSRHLAELRQSGIVSVERRGQENLYSAANPKIAEVCALMRTVLIEQMEEKSLMIKALK